MNVNKSFNTILLCDFGVYKVCQTEYTHTHTHNWIDDSEKAYGIGKQWGTCYTNKVLPFDYIVITYKCLKERKKENADM